MHGIIADAGRMIDVDSEEGRGTTFRIYLPPHSLDRDGWPGYKALSVMVVLPDERRSVVTGR